jgi:hypothetical protein
MQFDAFHITDIDPINIFIEDVKRDEIDLNVGVEYICSALPRLSVAGCETREWRRFF